jgi:hypothetical protein
MHDGLSPKRMEPNKRLVLPAATTSSWLEGSQWEGNTDCWRSRLPPWAAAAEQSIDPLRSTKNRGLARWIRSSSE